MAVNPMYARGFNAGYKSGYRSGLEGSAARCVMNRDLIWIYGCMALILTERGWTGDEAETLITDIQARWAGMDGEYDDSDMATYVRERTGIDLVQKAEEILKL